jgi:glycosyltransferase involved in cell wall biosynthesis
MSQPPEEPVVGVVMPVHNALPFLDEAIESILNQTLRDFEFVIYDDASSDGSAERLEHWARRDSRIRLFRGKRNLGPAASSNRVVRLSKSRLVARMDADDISHPDRLRQQVTILSQEDSVGVVASLCDVIDTNGRQIRGPDFWRLIRKSYFTPFPHGSIMFRRSTFDEVGGYRDECEFWEDLDLVLRLSRSTRILVLARPLYRYRQSGSSTRIASDQTRVETALDLRYRSAAALNRNDAYDDILANPSRLEERRVDPRVFLSLGLLALWSGRRPTSFAHVVHRARLRFDVATISTILWLCWVKVAPGTVRHFMNGISRFRNVRARSKLAGKAAVEWQPAPGPLATRSRTVRAGRRVSLND